MRFLLLTLCLAWSSAAFAQNTYVLALKNGHVEEYVGDYTVRKGLVIFTSPDGEKKSLSADVIDFPRTEEYRKIVDEKREQQKRISATKRIEENKNLSLAEQVEAYNRVNSSSGRRQVVEYTDQTIADGTTVPRDPLNRGTEFRPEGFEEEWEPEPVTMPSSVDYGQISEVGEQTFNRMQQEFENNKALLYGFYGFFFLFVVLGLASLGTWLFLTVASYTKSVAWGAALTLGMIFHIGSSLFAPGLVSTLAFLLHNILMIGYVSFECYGKRPLFVFLLYSPYILIFIAVLVIRFWLFP